MNFFNKFKISFLLKKASKQTNLNKAISLYLKILKIDSKLSAVYNYIGLCYFELNDYLNSEKYFLQSIENFSENFKSKDEVFYNIAFCYHFQKKYKESEYYYQKVIMLYPKYKYAYKNYGYLLVELKKYKEAISIFSKYLEFEKDAETLNNIGYIYDEMGKFSRAIDYYNQSIEVDYYFKPAYENLLSIYKHANNSVKFNELLEKAKTYNLNLKEEDFK